MYKINKNGEEYLSTSDSLLALGIFINLCQSNVPHVELWLEDFLFSRSDDVNVFRNPKSVNGGK